MCKNKLTVFIITFICIHIIKSDTNDEYKGKTYCGFQDELKIRTKNIEKLNLNEEDGIKESKANVYIQHAQMLEKLKRNRNEDYVNTSTLNKRADYGNIDFNTTVYAHLFNKTNYVYDKNVIAVTSMPIAIDTNVNVLPSLGYVSDAIKIHKRSTNYMNQTISLDKGFKLNIDSKNSDPNHPSTGHVRSNLSVNNTNISVNSDAINQNGTINFTIETDLSKFGNGNVITLHTVNGSVQYLNSTELDILLLNNNNTSPSNKTDSTFDGSQKPPIKPKRPTRPVQPTRPIQPTRPVQPIKLVQPPKPIRPIFNQSYQVHNVSDITDSVSKRTTFTKKYY